MAINENLGSGEAQPPDPASGIPAPPPPLAALQCSACHTPLEGTYFTANGQAMCAYCLENLRASMRGGSAAGRFFRAAFFGFFVALGCAVGNYLIVALTDKQYAIVAIGIGAAVGGAIKAGARGRGGWVYQGMAVVLAYMAISTSFIPFVYNEVKKEVAKDYAASNQGPPVGDGIELASNADAGEGDESEAPASEDGATSATAPALADGADAELDPESPAAKLFIALVAIPLALAMPFLSIVDNFITFVIIAIGIAVAWQSNKKPKLEIGGPFQAAPPAMG